MNDEMKEITKQLSTLRLSDELASRTGIQLIDIGVEEIINIQTGPIKFEVTGPARILIDYD